MSCSDYKTLSKGYLDNTMSVGRSMIEPYTEKVATITDLAEAFTNLVFSYNPQWYDCNLDGTQVLKDEPKFGTRNKEDIEKFGILKDVPYMNIIRELERKNEVTVDSIVFKETPTTFSVVKLCSGNSILNNRASDNMVHGSKIIRGDYGEILPYTHSQYIVSPAMKRDIFLKFTQFLEKQKWSPCNASDNVSSCEFNLNTNLSKQFTQPSLFSSKNSNPHIIQLIDMLRPMLRLKYEIIIFGNKVVFSRFCKDKRNNILSLI